MRQGDGTRMEEEIRMSAVVGLANETQIKCFERRGRKENRIECQKDRRRRGAV